MPERRVQRRFVEAAIIIDPAPEGGIDYTCQVFQGFVTTLVQRPSPHGPAYRRCGFVADRRAEADEVFSPAVLRFPRPERVAKEVEFVQRVITSPPGVLAIDNFRLVGMQGQTTVRQPLLNQRFQPFGLGKVGAVVDEL